MPAAYAGRRRASSASAYSSRRSLSCSSRAGGRHLRGQQAGRRVLVAPQERALEQREVQAGLGDEAVSLEQLRAGDGGGAGARIGAGAQQSSQPGLANSTVGSTISPSAPVSSAA
jgi:hypothetical protein